MTEDHKKYTILPDVALKDCTGYIDKDVEKYYTV
jgi:hypothetical protein